MEIVNAFPSYARRLSGHPLKTGFVVSFLVLLPILQFGDRAHWLILLPAVAAIIVGVFSELPRQQALSLSLVPLEPVSPSADAAQTKTAPGRAKVAKAVSKKRNTVRICTFPGYFNSPEQSYLGEASHGSVVTSASFKVTASTHVRRLVET